MQQRPTPEEVKRLLEYDPETGIFTWVGRPATWMADGARAGSVRRRGYRVITIRMAHYPEQVLAWVIMTGAWPASLIDHRDLDKANNRWRNLRLATKAQNNRNTPRRKDNTSGYKGVHFKKALGRWSASISMDGQSRHLGYFDTPELASAAYRAAAQSLHGEFASP